jgi:DHA1 family multidrug resistance protein-like MFS transporter
MQDDGFIALFRRYPPLLMLCVATAIIMLGQGLTTPVLPLYAKSFSASAASVGLTISAFGFARMLLNIPVGLASDRLGRRFVLIGGPLIVFVSSVMSGLAGSLGELLVWRFVAGAGSSMYLTGATVYLTDIADANTRSRMMGMNQGSLLLGVSLGPVVGGFVAQFVDFRAAFHLVGILSAFCAVWAFTAIPETNTKAHRTQRTADRAASGGGLRPIFALLSDRPFFLVGMVTLATFLTRSGGRQTIMPLLGADRFNLGPGSIGLLFTLISGLNLVTIPYASTWSDRFGRKAVIIPSALVTGLSLVILALSGSIWMVVVATVIHGLGTGFAGPAPATYAADVAPEQARGFAMGLYRTYGDVGLTIGPPIMGWIADHHGYNDSLYFNTLLIGITTVAFWLWARETSGRATRATPARRPASGLPVDV